ncbi:hypothetical protein [Shewanella sp.]|uniref:hypothetical protein n=1 Tax=Shewanella sp. TaxID=50422 RepID=UPI0040538406
MKHRLTLGLLVVGFILMAVMGLVDVKPPNIAPSKAVERIALNTTSAQEGDLVIVPVKAIQNTVIIAPKQAAHDWLDEPFITRIAQDKGQRLQQVLSDFWRLCQQEAECDERLQVLSQHLIDERFDLLRSYPIKLAQLQELLGNELMPHQVSLEDKVVRIQALQAQVWGTAAALLYFDEYQQYQFKLNAEALMDIQDPQTLVQALTALVKDGPIGNENGRDKHSQDTLGVTQYETALGLIPQDLNEADYQQVSAALAEQFLNASQQNEIKQRQQQVESQEYQVQDYQQGLAALYARLETQRASELAHLSNEAWQDYSRQQKAQFRTNFFASTP